MSNILKNTYSMQDMPYMEYADNVEEYDMKKRNRHYRSLKIQAVGAWLFTVSILLLATFHNHISYSNEIQMVLTIPVLLFFGASFYSDAWKHIHVGHSSMDILIALSSSVAFLFSLFNTFFPEFWYSFGLEPDVYYEVAVFIIAVGLTGKLLHFLPEELHNDERIAGTILPSLLGISVFVFFMWIIFGGMAMLPYAVYSIITVLIIACPCALGMAVPVALMRGISKAAEKHIWIRNSIALERLDKVDVVVFDKTGTLTEGRPTVTAWLWAQAQETYFKGILLAAEMNSDDSLAVAVTATLKEENIIPVQLESYEILKGKGVKVVYGGITYWVGSHKLLKDYQVFLSDVLGDMLVEYESDGCSMVYFGRGNELLSIIAVKDQVMPASLAVVKELRGQDIEICMLTGDGQRTASSVAGSLGIIHYISDALPDDKKTFIRELQLQGKTVAMVGDGVTDVQALSCANVSIAMNKDADSTTEGAMVAMKSADLLLLPRLFRLSRHTIRLMFQNSFWAVIFHLVGVLIAAGILYPVYGVLLSPLLATVVIALSCISILLNRF